MCIYIFCGNTDKHSCGKLSYHTDILNSFFKEKCIKKHHPTHYDSFDDKYEIKSQIDERSKLCMQNLIQAANDYGFSDTNIYDHYKYDHGGRLY